MSDLIQEFPGRTFKEWERWYARQHPGAIDEATERIWSMLQKIRDALAGIDRDMVRAWTEDLVLVKTFVGLRVQGAIMAAVARRRGEEYRPAQASEESRGVDGYIGQVPVSVKPHTFRARPHPEGLEADEIIYYEKLDDGLLVYTEETSAG